jgi:hypothetical protein
MSLATLAPRLSFAFGREFSSSTQPPRKEGIPSASPFLETHDEPFNISMDSPPSKNTASKLPFG